MKEEIWKDVEGFSRYKVSNIGRVWDTKTNKEVSQVDAGIPVYKYVNMNRDDGKRKLVRVHRLVALAFIPLEEGYDIVDHIDRDKFNNHVSNLRWVNHSGNQRNIENNLMVGNIHLKDYVKRYENIDAAYNYIASRMCSGTIVEDALSDYHEYLEYGTKRTKVEWDGQEVYLQDLCTKYCKDYDSIKLKMSNGWNIFNAIYDIPPSHHHSIEVKGKLVDYWYKSKNILAREVGVAVDTLTERLTKCSTMEELIQYDPLDRLRVEIRGIRGTIGELCLHFGVSESAVSSRMARQGMTLEQALFAPRQRVKSVIVNGIKMQPKDLYESYGLNPKSAGSWKSKTNSSFEETLQHFGVDTTRLQISYI